MSYIPERPRPFNKMRELLLGKEMNPTELQRTIGGSWGKCKRKFDSPEYLTLGDLVKISTSRHIPIEELREAIVR